MKSTNIWHIIIGAIFVVGSLAGEYYLKDGNSRSAVRFVGIALVAWGITRVMVKRVD